MNIRKLPALVLATALQVLPLCRVACVNQAVAPTGFAIVMRWLAGAVALLGSYHAVSGASAAIVGVAAWTQITNGAQAGPVTTSASGTAGQKFLYKIIITTPATSGAQNDFYNYDSLPPGLTMNTNVGGADGAGNGFISGTPTQGGVYPVTLIAGNTLWGTPPITVTKAITITIAGGGATPPNITGPPVNQTVTVGTNVSFTATATGTAPLSYSWKFNGTAIAGATASLLQLVNVQTTNSGSYTITVTNSAGSQSASATLTVNSAATAPSITQEPRSLTVSNGATATFTVVATGTAPLSYQWIRGSASLLSATNSAYTITATTNDSGNYTVVITNSAGAMTSSVATLTVLLPPTIVTPPQNVTVTNGGTATLTVVVSGSPPLTYQWYLSGGLLAGATATSLTISNAQTANQGDYTVTVSNAVGVITSAPGHLTVQQPNAGPFQLANLLVSGSTLSFEVTGPSQTNYVIWSSTDLSHWTALKTNFATTGTVQFTNSNTSAVEFYRATLSP